MKSKCERHREFVMHKHQEVNRLLVKLSRVTEEGEGPSQHDQERYAKLLRQIDLTSHMENASWPGRSYILVGNSFNVEPTLKNLKMKRAACIALMLQQGRHNRNCVPVREALEDQGFVEVLSRFERDWLRRIPETSLLSAAYDLDGSLIAQAFAVWRKELALEAQPKQLARSRNR